MSIVEKALKRLQDVAGVARVPIDQPRVQRKRTPAQSKPVSEGQFPGRVVAINVAQLRAAELLPPESQEWTISQQYRHIKRPLISTAAKAPVGDASSARIIQVASAMPGEGKTFTCINLAFSLALEKDLHVLLVDADLAKPQISRELGIADEPGLLDVLRDPALAVEHAILATDVPRLSVLPAGKSSRDATELVASARMEQIIRELGESDPNRIVLLDSPPLLLTTESPLLAQLAGQVVVVVRAGVTSQRVLYDALSHIRQGPIVSLVLNQVFDAPSTGYHYYYNSVDARDTESE